MILLYKGGNKMELGQYRPVSLLPTFIRIFDKCLYSRIDHFLERNVLLSERQFGGRKNRNPIALVQDLMFKALEYFEGKEEEVVLVICYDQSKMFDRIEKHTFKVYKQHQLKTK